MINNQLQLLQKKLLQLRKQFVEMDARLEIITKRRIDADMGDDYRENEGAKLVMEQHDVWYVQKNALAQEIADIKEKISELNFGKKVKMLPKDRDDFSDKPQDHLLSLGNKLKNKKKTRYVISQMQYEAVILNDLSIAGLERAMNLYKSKTARRIAIIGPTHIAWGIKHELIKMGVSEDDIFLEIKNWKQTIVV